MLIYKSSISGNSYIDVFQGASPTGAYEVRVTTTSSVLSLATSTTTPSSPYWVLPASYTLTVKDQPLYIHNQGGSATDVSVVVLPLVTATLGLC